MENSDIKVSLDIEGPYWLTRDKEGGVLSDTVEVWLSKPSLERFEDGDVMWLPDLDLVDEEATHYAEWTIARCLKECGVYPETERECIVVGIPGWKQMGNGKKGIAPCGHEGEAVIGQYYECPRCDSKNLDYTPDWEIKTLQITKCPNCGSFNVDEDFQLDPMFYFFNPGAPLLNTRCEDCGHCWLK